MTRRNANQDAPAATRNDRGNNMTDHHQIGKRLPETITHYRSERVRQELPHVRGEIFKKLVVTHRYRIDFRPRLLPYRGNSLQFSLLAYVNTLARCLRSPHLLHQ